MAKRSRDNSVSFSSEDEADEQENNKYVHVEQTFDQQAVPPAIRCFLPPHRPYSFSSYEDFDSHYYKSHVNRCSECNKNFPSEHFLDLHITEVHDSLADAKQARGEKTFVCFVEYCDKLCHTPQKRRLHLIDKHHFPKNYNFFITKDGLDKRHSLLVPSTKQRSLSQQVSNTSTSTKSSECQSGTASLAGNSPLRTTSYSQAKRRDVSQDHEVASSSTSPEPDPVMTPASSNAEIDIDSLTKNMSSLKFVPNSVRFGRGGRGRGGLARK